MRNDFCNDYLEHSAKGTSWSKQGVKYIKRVFKNGKYVYYYAKKAGEWNNKKRNREREKSATVATAGYQTIAGKDVRKWAKKRYGERESAIYRAESMEKNYYNLALKTATDTFGKKGGEIITNLLYGHYKNK